MIGCNRCNMINQLGCYFCSVAYLKRMSRRKLFSCKSRSEMLLSLSPTLFSDSKYLEDGVKNETKQKQDPEVNDASSGHFFIFRFFSTFHFFSLSSSLLPPRRSFLLAPPSSSSLLPPCSSFFLVQHCLNHLESIKGHFSSILTKA